MKKLHIYSLLLLLCISLQAMAQDDWYNPMNGDEPYISGRAWNQEIGKTYNRLPERFKPTVTKSVWGLSHQCAGLSIRFVSNSHNIKVRYVRTFIGDYCNMAALDHSGVDLYGKTADGAYHWIGTHMGWKWTPDTVTMEWKQLSPPSYTNRGIEYQLYLPPYNGVKYLEIGVDKGSSFQFIGQSIERPIVVYGSSIIQGASPSRPGNMITSMVERDLQYPVVNLGFSGSALMERGIFNALSEINARAFIIDPMPNSFGLNPDTIIARAKSGILKLRSKSNAPILMVEAHPMPDEVFRPDINEKYRNSDKKFHQAYEQLKSEGIKNLFYLSSKDIAFTEDAMIEGTHPNDIGNRAYADAYEKKIREMLPEDEWNKRYPPVTQRRDGCYEWMLRHNAVLKLNHTTNPEILMIGNSITHFWGGNPQMGRCNGGKTWKQTFGNRRVTNMGFGWDRIENVFWRIYHGELEGCEPKHICLLIGINNYADKEEDIAQGVVDLAKLIRERQPEARLHVIKIYPAKNREEKVARINKLIEKKLVCDNMTELVDLSACLTLKNGSGKIDPSCFCNDGLHPNEVGYAALGKVLKKHLK